MLCTSMSIKKGPSGPWQAHYRLEPAYRQIPQSQRAAVSLYDIARNAQPQPAAAGVTISRGFEPIERFKHPFQLLVRDSGTFIPDADHQRGAVLDNDSRL